MANVAQLTTAEYTARFNDQMSSGAQAAAEAMEKLARASENADASTRKSSSSFAAMEARLDSGVRLARAKAQADAQLARDTEGLNAAVARGLTTQEAANRLLQSATQQRDLYIAKVQRQIQAEEARNAVLLGGAVATDRVSAANDNATRSSGRFGQAMGQAGFQVQDFATQVSMGQNALVAFSTQFAQFAGIFGTAGAIAGAAVTLGVIAYQLLGAGDATKALNDALKGSEEGYSRANTAAEAWQRGLRTEAEEILRLTQYYASLDSARRSYEVRSLEASRRTLESQAVTVTDDARAPVRGLEGRVANVLEFRRVNPRAAAEPLSEQVTETVRLLEVYRELSRTDPARAILNLAEGAERLRQQGGPLTEDLRRLVTTLDEAVPNADRLSRQLGLNAAQLAAARGEAPGTADGITAVGAAANTATGRASNLATEIGRTAAALAALRRQATADPLAAMQQEFAQIEAQLRALRTGGVAALEATRTAQDDNNRAVEASNRIYEDQLRLLREQGVAQADAERQAGEAARAALDLMNRRNAAARQLSAEEKAAEDARRAAAQAATEQGRRAEQQRRDEAAAAREAERERRQMEREAERDAQRERERQVQQQRQAYDEIANAGRRAFEQVGDTIVEAFVKGEQSSIRFGNVARAVAASLLQTFLRLAIVNPATNAIFGTSAPTLGMAMAGQGGMSGLAGLGGLGAGVSGFLSTPMWGPAANVANPASLAATNPAALWAALPATPTGATAAPTWGQALGGMAGGFAIGSSLGMLTARGSPARQTNGMIGSAAGTAAGAMIGSIVPGVGTVVGALIGGALGGAGGGLFGPGRATPFANVSVVADDGRLSVTGAGGKNTDVEGMIRDVRRQIEAMNDQLDQRGWQLAGGSNIGSGVTGLTQFDSIGDSTQLRLRTGDKRVDSVLSQLGDASLDRQLSLAQRAQAFADQLDGLTNAIKDQTDPLGGILRQFDEMRETADRIGFGWDQIAEAQAAAVQEFERTRARANEDTWLDLSARAAGTNRAAQLTAQQQALAITQQREREDLARELAAIGVPAEFIAHRMQELEAALKVEADAIARAWEDLWRAQREAVEGLSVRASRARAALSGSAVDAERADLQAFDLRAAGEIIDTRRALADLGMAAEAVDAELRKLTQTHDMERRAIIASYEARRRAIAQALDDRLLAATTDTRSAAGALALFERQAAREREQAAREGLTNLVQLETVHAAERAQLMENFARQAADRIYALGNNIRRFLDGLQTNAAYASPQDRFTAAQAQFQRDLSAARGGDEEALGRITGTADALLTAGRDMFASGPQFQALMAMVRTSLEGLPAMRNYDALILEELQKLKDGINVGVEVEVVRTITEALNALPAADRDRLVQSATIIRRIEEQIGRYLALSEIDALVRGGVIRREIEQALGRTLTAEERAAIVAPGTDLRILNQVIGRTLTDAERASLISSETVLRAIEQRMQRTLTTEERAGLVGSATVLRSIEQQIGRALTATEIATIVTGGTVARNITQTIQAPSGAQLITAADITRQIQLSFDFAVQQQFSYLHNLADIRMFLSHIRDMARGAAGGLRVTTWQASGAANDGFAQVTWNSTTRNTIANPSAGLRNFGGLQEGGWVGNGTWNRDSVIAAYAGGGDIMLAGGEHVTNAVQAARYRPVLDSINAGTYAADNGETVRELRALRAETAALRGEVAALRTEATRGADASERTADAAEDTAQTNRTMARGAAVVGARQRRAG